jgi:hypothetical protein
MTKNPANTEHPDDDDRGLDRIDADPPYNANYPAEIQRFREFLAEMIARQILAERRGPKPPDGETKP